MWRFASFVEWCPKIGVDGEATRAISYLAPRFFGKTPSYSRGFHQTEGVSARFSLRQTMCEGLVT